MQNDIKNPFIIKAAKFFFVNPQKLFIVKLSYLMPWLIPILTQIIHVMMILFNGLRYVAPRIMVNFEELPGLWIINQVKQVIDARIAKVKSGEEGQRRIDLLQLMLDAATSNEVKVRKF